MKTKNIKPLIGVFFAASLVLSMTAYQLPAVAATASKTAVTKVNIKNYLPKDSEKIKKFKNLSELKSFLEDNTTSGGGIRYYKTGGVSMLSDSSSVKAAPMAETAGVFNGANDSTQVSNDYSKTNVQVEGVDEADIVKTDGEYIYTISNKNLQIVKAYPTEKAQVLTTIKFKNQPQEMYVSGNRLVVYGQDNYIYQTKVYQSFRRYSNYTFVKVFDISDKKTPKELRDLSFEGSASDSRLVGDYLYFLTNNWQYNYNADPLLPRILENGKVISGDKDNARYKVPNIYYFDTHYNSVNFTVLASINIKDNVQAINTEVYLLPNSQTLYASEHNLYLTYPKYFNEQQLVMEISLDLLKDKISDKHKKQIAAIKAADKLILTDDEKTSKIAMIIGQYTAIMNEKEQADFDKKVKEVAKNSSKDLAKEMEKTIIHRIAYNNGKFEYKAQGEVYGSILNQFSMDESGDYFRIATTKNRNWSSLIDEKDQKSYANLFVLNQDLRVVGSLEGLANNERIYAVRFMGKRGYLVTFQQTDPLFAIDLSNPNQPKVLGELKVPGFSQYLHPYDENTLIGFGRQTENDSNGNVVTKGLKLSLFDVKDVKNPKELATYSFGGRGSDSIALYDHKAFLFSRSKNLLSIPVTLTKYSGDQWGDVEFDGAMAFKVDPSGFKLLAQISHNDSSNKRGREYWWGWDYYNTTVKRSLYINDVFYTISGNYVKAHDMKNWQELKSVQFEAEDYTIENPTPIMY